MSEPSYVEQWSFDELESRVSKLEVAASGGLELLQERDYLKSLLHDALLQYEYGTGRITKELAEKMSEAYYGRKDCLRKPKRLEKKTKSAKSPAHE
jgi:hypothetical protein